MHDISKSNYSCDDQTSFEDCLKEIDSYKWDTGQYMNLPQTEVIEDEYNRLHSGRRKKRNFKE